MTPSGKWKIKAKTDFQCLKFLSVREAVETDPDFLKRSFKTYYLGHPEDKIFSRGFKITPSSKEKCLEIFPGSRAEEILDGFGGFLSFGWVSGSKSSDINDVSNTLFSLEQLYNYNDHRGSKSSKGKTKNKLRRTKSQNSLAKILQHNLSKNRQAFIL